MQDEIIKSISYNQDEILEWIIRLYCQGGFDLDPTYSKGNFYKNIPKLFHPKIKSDINPQFDDVEKWDCTNLPLENESLNSIIFDPPFIAAIPKKKAEGIITQRFGYYRNIQHEMWSMYYEALKEFYRILKLGGFLIFKCQDTIDSCKQYLSHVEIINDAISLGFYPKDFFILLAKHRIIGKHHHKQQHARKLAYFLHF